MPETATATKTSSDKAPAPPTPAAAPAAAAGPMVNGMSPAEAQQRFGNQGTAQALNGPVADGQAVAAPADGQPEAPVEVVALSPFEATAPARQGVSARAKRQKRHPEASEPVDSAQKAAVDAKRHSRRTGAANTVKAIDDVPEGKIDKTEEQSFEALLRAALHEAIEIPDEGASEDEAKRVVNEGGQAGQDALSGEVGDVSEKQAKPLDTALANDAEPDAAPVETVLEPETVGAAPEPVGAESVVPPPLPDSKLDYSDHAASTDQVMAENQITEEQLAKGNEPTFSETLGAREEAKAHAETGAVAFRESEAATRAATGGEAQLSIDAGLDEFYGTRTGQVGDVVTTQNTTKTTDEQRRENVTKDIDKIKDDTKTDVGEILDTMETDASAEFNSGLELAKTAFNNTFDENLGGFNILNLLGPVGWALSAVGVEYKVNKDVQRAIETGRNAFQAQVDLAVDAVVVIVNKALADAKTKVAEGREQVDVYVKALPDDIRAYGLEQQALVQSDFDELESDIDSRRDNLVTSLVNQYKEALEWMEAREEELRLANMSIWDRIYAATVGLIEKILEFKNLLMSVLAGAQEIVLAIIADPIGFLSNLIAGIMGGLNRFKDNIVEHLKGGLMGWLVGSLQGAGIELPTSFDLKGIFQLVFGILGVTYQIIRKKAVKLLGEKTVERLEGVADILIVLVNEGPAGLWEMFVEKMGDIKEMILGEIRNFVITKIIIAGITWLISLLNPASAFFKACKAIYDIVMFFIDRGQQIMELVNTIIESIAAIVAGNVAAMSEAIENVLSRILPVAISFLASLLGLGGISDKIKDIIKKIQKKIEAGVDWVVDKIVGLAKKLFGRGGQASDDDADPAELPTSPDELREAVWSDLMQRSGGEVEIEEVDSLLAATADRYRELGLKSIKVEASDDFGLVVSVEASPFQRTGLLKARFFSESMRWGGTVYELIIRNKTTQESYEMGTEQASGGVHAERYFEETILEFFSEDDGTKSDDWEILLRGNRSPCQDCAQYLNGLATRLNQDGWKVAHRIQFSSLYGGQGKAAPVLQFLQDQGFVLQTLTEARLQEALDSEGIEIDDYMADKIAAVVGFLRGKIWRE